MIGEGKLSSIDRLINLSFGCCPKKGVCTCYSSKGETCRHGPFEYCGRYRERKLKD